MANKQNEERLILVTGATGKQGGAVARSLLDRGFQVRGLTRNPQKPEAQALANQGAEVVQGDMEERSSMERALEGAYGVFSVQNFWESGYDGELQQGKTVADAAKAAGVEHFVYSSVGSAHRQTGIPHFESKWEIEEHVRQIGLPYTILRPVFLMQNWEWTREMILGGTLAQPFDPDKPLQQVAVEDIGAFAAIAFENPDRWIGREVDLAGDEQSMSEIADTFSRVIGREVSYYQVPWDQFEEQVGEEVTLNSRWMNDVGYEADIAALRQEYPELTSFERYLRSHGWEGAEVPAGS
jgi:uncharacterized protein YbjT (DUF2867 family)